MGGMVGGTTGDTIEKMRERPEKNGPTLDAIKIWARDMTNDESREWAGSFKQDEEPLQAPAMSAEADATS